MKNSKKWLLSLGSVAAVAAPVAAVVACGSGDDSNNGTTNDNTEYQEIKSFSLRKSTTNDKYIDFNENLIESIFKNMGIEYWNGIGIHFEQGKYLIHNNYINFMMGTMYKEKDIKERNASLKFIKGSAGTFEKIVFTKNDLMNIIYINNSKALENFKNRIKNMEEFKPGGDWKNSNHNNKYTLTLSNEKTIIIEKNNNIWTLSNNSTFDSLTFNLPNPLKIETAEANKIIIDFGNNVKIYIKNDDKLKSFLKSLFNHFLRNKINPDFLGPNDIKPISNSDLKPSQKTIKKINDLLRPIDKELDVDRTILMDVTGSDQSHKVYEFEKLKLKNKSTS